MRSQPTCIVRTHHPHVLDKRVGQRASLLVYEGVSSSVLAMERLVELPLAQALDIASSLLQESDTVLPVATNMLERLRQGIDDEHGAEKVLKVLALYGSSHSSITDQLLELLTFCEYPKLIIDALTALTGNEEEEVHKVTVAYKTFLSTEGSLWLPILGSLAELELPERSKKIGFGLIQQSLNVVGEEDVPVVVRTLLRTITKKTAYTIVGIIRKQCAKISIANEYLVHQVVDNMARIDSQIPQFLLKSFRGKLTITEFGLTILLNLSITQENELKSLQCLIEAVAENRLAESIVLSVCRRTKDEEWAHLANAMLGFCKYLLSSVVQVNRGMGLRDAALSIVQNSVVVLLETNKESCGDIVSMLATIASCSPCLYRSDKEWCIFMDDYRFSTGALVGIYSANILFRVVQANPKLLQPHAHIVEDVLFRPQAGGKRMLPLWTLHRLCQSLTGIYSASVDNVTEGSSSTAFSDGGYNRRQYANLLISVQKTLVSGLFTGRHSFISQSGEDLNAEFSYQRTGMIVAMHLLLRSCLNPDDRRSIVSWVLRVMMASSLEGPAIEYGLDLLVHNAKYTSSIVAKEILEKVVIHGLKAQHLYADAQTFLLAPSRELLSIPCNSTGEEGRAVVTLDLAAHRDYTIASSAKVSSRVSCARISALWNCFLHINERYHGTQTNTSNNSVNGEGIVLSACATSLVMPAWSSSSLYETTVENSQPPEEPSNGLRPSPKRLVGHSGTQVLVPRRKKRQRKDLMVFPEPGVPRLTMWSASCYEDTSEKCREDIFSLQSLPKLIELGQACANASAVFCTTANFVSARLNERGKDELFISIWRDKYKSKLWENGIQFVYMRLKLTYILEALAVFNVRKRANEVSEATADKTRTYDLGSKNAMEEILSELKYPIVVPTPLPDLGLLGHMFTMAVTKSMLAAQSASGWDVHASFEIARFLSARLNDVHSIKSRPSASYCADFRPFSELVVMDAHDILTCMLNSNVVSSAVVWSQHLLLQARESRRSEASYVRSKTEEGHLGEPKSSVLMQTFILVQDIIRIICILCFPFLPRDNVTADKPINIMQQNVLCALYAGSLARNADGVSNTGVVLHDAYENVFVFFQKQLSLVEESCAALIIIETLSMLTFGNSKSVLLSELLFASIQDIYPVVLDSTPSHIQYSTPYMLKTEIESKMGMSIKLNTTRKETDPPHILAHIIYKGPAGVHFPPALSYLVQNIVVLCSLQIPTGSLTGTVSMLLDAMEAFVRNVQDGDLVNGHSKVFRIRGLTADSYDSFLELFVRISVCSVALCEPWAMPIFGVRLTPYDDYFVALSHFSRFVQLFFRANTAGAQGVNTLLHSSIHCVHLVSKKTEDFFSWRTKDVVGRTTLHRNDKWYSRGHLNVVILSGNDLCRVLSDLCAASKSIPGVDVKLLPSLKQNVATFTTLLKNLQDLYHIKIWSEFEEKTYTKSVSGLNCYDRILRQCKQMPAAEQWTNSFASLLSSFGAEDAAEPETMSVDKNSAGNGDDIVGFQAIFHDSKATGEGESSEEDTDSLDEGEEVDFETSDEEDPMEEETEEEDLGGFSADSDDDY